MRFLFGATCFVAGLALGIVAADYLEGNGGTNASDEMPEGSIFDTLGDGVAFDTDEEICNA